MQNSFQYKLRKFPGDARFAGMINKTPSTQKRLNT